jgi:hypothetical protein
VSATSEQQTATSEQQGPPLPPDSSLTSFDQTTIQGVTFTLFNGTQIYFQFPPKIVSEGNVSNWEEKDIWAIEPLRIHKGSAGRKLTMQWEYVASDSLWNCIRIPSMLRNLKSYFFTFKREIYPIVKIQFGNIIPIPMNFRIMDLDITYSEELISNPPGSPIHPLYTKVSVNLTLATRVQQGGGGNEVDKVEVDPLVPINTQWY